MSSMSEQRTAEGKRAAQGRATRGQLIDVATRLFAEQGYEGTSIEAVLAAAGVSRGALYHHFAGKEALFEAVVSAATDRVTAELTEAISGCSDPVDAVRTGAVAWIGLALDPMDDGRTLGAMRAMLQAVSDSGRLPGELVAPFAHMILAGLDEIVLVIARADDVEAAVAEGTTAVEALLSRLLRP
jgi:AcrR family transcriptional regulator